MFHSSFSSVILSSIALISVYICDKTGAFWDISSIRFPVRRNGWSDGRVLSVNKRKYGSFVQRL